MAEARSDLEVVQGAFQRLPSRHKSVLYALRIEEQSRQEVAVKHGISLRTLDTTLRQALQHCAERTQRPILAGVWGQERIAIERAVRDEERSGLQVRLALYVFGRAPMKVGAFSAVDAMHSPNIYFGPLFPEATVLAGPVRGPLDARICSGLLSRKAARSLCKTWLLLLAVRVLQSSLLGIDSALQPGNPS